MVFNSDSQHIDMTMEVQIREYLKLFGYVDSLFGIIGSRLTANKPKSVLLGFATNWIVWVLIAEFLLFGYQLAFETSDRFTFVQHTWLVMSMTQWIISAFNIQIHWDQLQALVSWYRDIYTRKYPVEYQKIIEKKCTRMNNLIKLTFR